VPLYFVSKLASQHVKVVLTGEGSDELLAGYDKYRKTVYNLALGRAYHTATPNVIKRAIERAIFGMKGASRARQKLIRTFFCLSPDIENIYFDNFSVFSRAMQSKLFTNQAREQMSEYGPYRDALAHVVALVLEARPQTPRDLIVDLDCGLVEERVVRRLDELMVGADRRALIVRHRVHLEEVQSEAIKPVRRNPSEHAAVLEAPAVIAGRGGRARAARLRILDERERIPQVVSAL